LDDSTVTGRVGRKGAALSAHSANLERRPAVRRLVSRGPLFDRLSTAGPGDVILVCAPAGSGKTVLLRSWIESEALADRTAWVSVERGERDAQRFWLSAVDALAAAVGGAGRVERIAAAPTFDGHALVEGLVSALGSVDRLVVLVIDDLHELRTAEALRWLEFLVTQRIPQLRMVLATRQDPGLGLHRVRVGGGLIEIRGVDLRFSLEETRALIAVSGITLSDRALERLHERTEGWAAGLRLAAIALARHPDPERFVAEFSGSERTVADYLLAEVLEGQPGDVRDLLLRTSLLERVSGPLADAMTGRTGSEAILHGLEDENAFVTSLDVGRSWFRYHHLLADLLRLELRRTSPALIPRLHRVATQWLDEHGYAVDAIRHAQSAQEWRHAARLLADNVIDLVLDGRKETLRALLAAFPADWVEGDGELAFACAAGCLYDGLLSEGAVHIAAAERLAATVPDERRRLFDIRLSSARLWLACQRGDLDGARRAMRAGEAQPAGTLARGNDYRASAMMNLGIAELWSLELDDARRDLEDALVLARRIARPYLEVGCLSHLALAAVLSGSSIPAGLRLGEQAVMAAEAHGWGTHRIVAPAVAASAAALAWLGRVDEAEQWLERVEHAEAAAEEFQIEPVLRYAHAFVRLAQGRFVDALADFRAVERARPFLAPQHALPMDVRAWILHTQLLLGQTGAARAALAALNAEERGTGGMRIAAAALALADGRPQDALGVLEPVVGGAAEQVVNARRATVHALLLDGVARDRLGDSGLAEASIERALELAEQDGMILQFTLVPVRGLLERHPRHRTAHATLLSTILDVLDGIAPQPSSATPLRDELSEAELRVLRYLPSNLTAPEIAGELFVSANTVRTHLRHIYAKLDAHGRGEAVTRARDLGLLAPGGRRR
jgi:LuxR family transcriptional regulator, maltose regulon positive regulatory protein